VPFINPYVNILNFFSGGVKALDVDTSSLTNYNPDNVTDRSAWWDSQHDGFLDIPEPYVYHVVRPFVAEASTPQSVLNPLVFDRPPLIPGFSSLKEID
jgi:hypothetical protein